MTQQAYNDLINKSKAKKVFSIVENGKFYTCENIGDLPYKNTTLDKYMEMRENAYNKQLDALQEQINKLTEINKKLYNIVKAKEEE